jgi:hypothetical protein
VRARECNSCGSMVMYVITIIMKVPGKMAVFTKKFDRRALALTSCRSLDAFSSVCTCEKMLYHRAKLPSFCRYALLRKS